MALLPLRSAANRLSSINLRRLRPFIFLSCLTAIIVFVLTYNFHDDIKNYALGSLRDPSTTDDDGPLRIAIIESLGSHDEVLAALVHALGSQRNAELTVYRSLFRFEIERIMDDFLLPSPVPIWFPLENLAADLKHSPLPHILVATTCEFDPLRQDLEFAILLERGSTHLFCVVHHADQWREGEHVDRVKRWAEQGLVDFVTLSQHTADFLREQSLASWEMEAAETTAIRVLPPVFPVQRPDPDAVNGLSLAIQGEYSSSRRDYQGIFSHLATASQKAMQALGKTLSLHLIGTGFHQDLPEDVRVLVVWDSDLSYPQFYGTISHAFALLPAFASDEYLDRKASSSIPASLIAGAPIVASEELLAAYTYVPREAVWFQNPGESEMDVVLRVVENEGEYIRKRDLVRGAASRLLKDNVAHVKEWLHEARYG